MAQLPGSGVDVDEFIAGKDTAVVQLKGNIPAAFSRGEKFDVQVRPVDGSDTTSLHGGWLYQVELRRQGPSGGQSRTLATAEGAVFVNMIGTSEPAVTEGYVLGGGAAKYDYTGDVRPNRANFMLASTIRNRLNERYGADVAQAVSAAGVEFVIPPAYQQRKARFLSMVAATYLTETPELLRDRIDVFLQQLPATENKERSEIVLEAIGRRCLPKLATLLEAPDPEVRFRAARCMLNLGDDRAWGPLRAMAMDEASSYRLEALDAIVAGARRNDAALLARRLLRDSDVRVILAAYEHLRRMEDVVIQQEFVGRSFYLEQVAQTDRQGIFVSRSGDPRIVLFGAPLRCRDNLFVESSEGTVVVDSRSGQDYASLTRQARGRPGVIGPVRSGLAVSEIVRALGAEPRARDGGPSGLGVPYADVIAVLEQLSAKEAVAAEFWAGPLPKIGLLVKK